MTAAFAEGGGPYYADDWLTIYQGDVRVVLPELASDSVDCIVTSPPYWGLRDYGTATWLGGSAECDHKRHIPQHANSSSTLTRTGGPSGQVPFQPMRESCTKCGAVRQDSQIGLERTPEEYVASLVAVFRELRRVLKPSGTCWLNLGDSYASSGGERTYGSSDNGTGRGDGTRRHDVPASGLKPKDLVGIPWRVAFALQADGWYLRSDIIWAKPNPMPESVTDRPTKAHEYLFLLTKSARYYFDADAVREAGSGQSAGNRNYKYAGLPGHETKQGIVAVADVEWKQRNLRSVWNIATRPYPGAHFAVFPPELPERCIKAGSSERGVCPDCGKPWERMVERVTAIPQRNGEWKATGEDHRNDIDRKGGFYPEAPSTTGWQPSCSCNWDPLLPASEPAVVLDPFAGSGTTGMVANRLSRRAILIDLNGDYLKQQLQRNAQTPLGLAG